MAETLQPKKVFAPIQQTKSETLFCGWRSCYFGASSKERERANTTAKISASLFVSCLGENTSLSLSLCCSLRSSVRSQTANQERSTFLALSEREYVCTDWAAPTRWGWSHGQTKGQRPEASFSLPKLLLIHQLDS